MLCTILKKKRPRVTYSIFIPASKNNITFCANFCKRILGQGSFSKVAINYFVSRRIPFQSIVQILVRGFKRFQNLNRHSESWAQGGLQPLPRILLITSIYNFWLPRDQTISLWISSTWKWIIFGARNFSRLPCEQRSFDLPRKVLGRSKDLCSQGISRPSRWEKGSWPNYNPEYRFSCTTCLTNKIVWRV